LQFLFPYPGESRKITSCDNQTLSLFLLAVVTFAIMSDNVPGISDVPVPLGLAESLPLYFLMPILQAL